MLQCLSSNSSSSSSQPTSAPVGGPSPHPPPSEGWYFWPCFYCHYRLRAICGIGSASSSAAGPSTNGTPQSSGILSPINIHRQYDHALQTDSYREIWTLFHESCLNSHDQEVHVYSQEAWERTRDRVLTDVLRPDSKVVKEALGRVKRSKLTDLTSAFFDESEKATELFIKLQAGVHQARAIYNPLLNLLSVLPLDTEGLSVAQCRRAEEIFIQFSQDENPSLFTGSNIFKPMRECSLKLKEHLISCVRKSRSRVRLVHRATSKSGLCLIGTAAVAVVSAAAITAHFAIVAAAGPCVIPCLQPGKFVERELSCASLLDGAARAVYALYEHLETVDRLVERLQTTIEGDRWLIQIGLERSNDTASTQEVLKHLKRSPSNFLEQLDHLMVDTCLWFTNVNKARELLFQEIRPRADLP